MSKEIILDDVSVSTDKVGSLIMAESNSAVLKLHPRGWAEDATLGEAEGFLFGDVDFDSQERKIYLEMADHHIHKKRKVDGIWHRERIADILTRTYVIADYNIDTTPILKWIKQWRNPK